MAKVFFSYSHADEVMRDRLQKHLTQMKNEGLIEFWHDRMILAGEEFDNSIGENIEQADVILLLISADFLASTYCYSVELTRALEREKAGTARVIPVVLHPCDWHTAPFGKLLAAPKDGKPISLWANPDADFLDVAQKIRTAIGNSQIKPATSPAGRVVPTSEILSTLGSMSALPARSSNLSVRKRFTDRDRDQFEQDTFDYIAGFFETSLQELERRHSDQVIQTRFSRIDMVSFSACIYQDGQSVSECSIRIARAFGRGIAYSNNANAASNTMNEQLTVESDDQIQFLKPLMSSFGGRDKEKLSQQGAAEHYWEKLMEPLQR